MSSVKVNTVVLSSNDDKEIQTVDCKKKHLHMVHKIK